MTKRDSGIAAKKAYDAFRKATRNLERLQEEADIVVEEAYDALDEAAENLRQDENYSIPYNEIRSVFEWTRKILDIETDEDS